MAQLFNLLKNSLYLTAVLCVSACSNQPIKGKLPTSLHPVYQSHGLIEISQVDPTIEIDLRYKSPKNITGKALYPQTFPALVRRKTAQRLKEANELLKQRHRLKIKVWDAYRPASAHEQLWQASDKQGIYVTNPETSPSKHTFGTAVDVTLVDLNGKNVPMPTDFDDFTLKAASAYPHKNSEVLANLRALQTCMAESGFHLIESEWWHFVDFSFRHYQQKIELDP